MDTRAHRLSYLTDFLENIECNTRLSEPSIIETTPDHVLLPARGKLQRRKDEVLQEMEALHLDMSSEQVESADVEEVGEANSADVAPEDSSSSRKRTREDLMEWDSDFDLTDDIEKMFGYLSIRDQSVVGWLTEGEGGAMTKCLTSMISIIGKRLSSVTAEMGYLMSYGSGSAANWQRFKSDIEAEVSKSVIVKTRIRKAMQLSEHLTPLHFAHVIHPDLHDLLFENYLAGLVAECSTMMAEVESLFALQKAPIDEPPSEKLKRIIEQLMEMDAGIHSIEFGVMNCRILFSAYSDLAKLRIKDFVRDIETPVNQLWDDDLKKRNSKRSRV